MVTCGVIPDVRTDAHINNWQKSALEKETDKAKRELARMKAEMQSEMEQIAAKTQRQRDTLVQQFQKVSELAPGFGEQFALEDFLWARSAASSRLFGLSRKALPELSDEEKQRVIEIARTMVVAPA